jgi:hypothetical protein
LRFTNEGKWHIYLVVYDKGIGSRWMSRAKKHLRIEYDMFPQTIANLGYVSKYERGYVPKNNRG